ncbi:sugar ABC transporter ATP-binding protein [Lichenifustis flavocetrariae]|uniref:Sugar ABC transporter ATP-binding protein n=1 Tax=Lichenifustis flavocetrariae TaxID=2949735 RepID=A0AA41Z684_9HYPH|nr:sugar ABC transporter ATP-binding protein [Lichenifustis flavocetrariae]MCW6511258.1 sugar ABC transporter ATP-binding protein [Lichenifustis flavocetrariae]
MSAVAAAQAGTPPALHFWNLSKTFGGQKALDNATLTVAPGEVHGLLGQNGSGKSTLIKVLAGFHPPDPGSRLAMSGVEVPLPLAPGAFRQYRMSFVHQHLGLLPSLTVLENLLVGRFGERQAWAINWPGERRRAEERFAAYGVSIDPGARVADIAPIERALLAIVRAAGEISEGVGTGNGLLVLDEPTPFLPKRDVERLFRLVRTVVGKGASVIFVSHDVDEVLEITDRATVLRDGRVAATLDTAGASKTDFIEAIIGRRLAAARPPEPPAVRGASHAIIHDLAGGTIDGFSLDLAAGEVVGLTGLIGSGYDEVPYMIYGARPAVRGSLDLGGQGTFLPDMTPAKAIARGVVLIPADRANAGVIGPLPVSDNVTMPVLGTRFRRWLLNRGAMVTETGALSRRFDVRPPDPTLPIASLSGGNAQKVVLAKWFQTDPQLILLDEPTQGVDVGARQNVFRHIADAAARGAAVLCASSDYEQLAALCSRVLIFGGGRVVASLQGAEISKDAIAERSLAGAAP